MLIPQKKPERSPDKYPVRYPLGESNAFYEVDTLTADFDGTHDGTEAVNDLVRLLWS